MTRFSNTANGQNAKRIILTGAGGAPALNFIKSIRLTDEPVHFIGVDCSEYSLARAQTEEKYLVPRASEDEYIPILRELVERTGAEFIFAQPDPEIAIISDRRDDLPVRTYMPAKETVRRCQNKYETFAAWEKAGLRVPETKLIESMADLEELFARLGEVWLRPVVGAAGRGALHARNLEQARVWIEFNEGWGRYTGAGYLGPNSVTWQSLWHEGELIVAQGRLRLYWEFGDRAPSGVTGITGGALTVSDPVVDDLALRAIRAVDERPHGVFSVDLTYDQDGVPNPTEINIGRFFTTHFFFSRAGLNMPHMLVKLAFGEEPSRPQERINPLPAGLAWIRGMDMDPVLTDTETLEGFRRGLEERRNQILARGTT